MKDCRRIFLVAVSILIGSPGLLIAAQTLDQLIVLGSTPVLPSYFQLGVPKNSTHPHLAKLFVGFIASKQTQDIIDKLDFRSSHLVEGTRMARYLRENPIKLQAPKEAYYLQGEESGL